MTGPFREFVAGETVVAIAGRPHVVHAARTVDGEDEYLCSLAEPEPVGVRRDGSPMLSYGYPHWVRHYLVWWES